MACSGCRGMCSPPRLSCYQLLQAERRREGVSLPSSRGGCPRFGHPGRPLCGPSRSLPGKGVNFEVCESELLERQVDERHGARRMRGVERDPQDHFLSRRGADDRGKVRVPCSGTPSPVPGVQAPAPIRGHLRPAAGVPEQPSGCLTLCLLF